MIQKIKQTIITGVVIIIAFIGIKMFFSELVSTNNSLIADNPTLEQFTDGQIILSLLDDLNSVTLDTSIFSNNVFASLVSFEQPIQEQVSGRLNPFLPIGIESSGAILPQASTTLVN